MYLQQECFLSSFLLRFTGILCAGLRGAPSTPCQIWQYLVHIKFSSIPVCLRWIWFLILHLQPQNRLQPRDFMPWGVKNTQHCYVISVLQWKVKLSCPSLRKPSTQHKEMLPCIGGLKIFETCRKHPGCHKLPKDLDLDYSTSYLCWKKQGYVGDWQRDWSRVHWK